MEEVKKDEVTLNDIMDFLVKYIVTKEDLKRITRELVASFRGISVDKNFKI